MINQISWVLFAIPSILIASTIHEYAHAYSAYKLGDNTAKINGRLTLNPLAHIDPIGAIMMVIARFGWSKPVPINEYNFKNPVVGTAITSFAGPASNLLLATIAAIPLRISLSLFDKGVQTASTELNYITVLLLTFILVNVSLGVFNLIPLPPLDGHKIVRAFLPPAARRLWEDLDKYGFLLLFLLFLPLSPLSQVTYGFLSGTANFIISFLIG